MSAPPDTPLVSVVVVNYNGRRHLERCFPALFGTVGIALEVIVADNGSTDGSVEWLAERWPRARVLALGRNLGFGAANNRAARAARGEFLALLNNDTVVEPEWLSALLEPLRAEAGVGAACATLRLLDHPDLLNARGGGMTSAGYGYDIDFMVPAERPPLRNAGLPWRDVLFATAAAAMFRREEFLALGGFDSAMFMYHEDVDLGLRYWLAGRRVVVCDRAVVHHAFGGTTRAAHGLAWRERLGMRHNIRTLLKCFGPISLARTLLRIARVWWRHRALGQALAVGGWNLLHLPTTLLERRRVQGRKVLTEGELYRRGLITGAAWPPATPQPPAPETLDGKADWIETPTLLPAQHSALGRLGPGWYAPEPVDGDAARWTCGLARCVLNVGPDRAGAVEAEVTLGPGRTDAAVTISCNGASASTAAGARWSTVTLPARAGHDGLLHVSLACAPWVPHPVTGNWDFRTVGCAVRAVRFRPAAAPATTADPRVSVIVPTFNRWAILERSLEALARQTYRHLEVIVVDDGSTDGTWERLQAWQRGNDRRLDLTILHQENLKPGRARNLGLGRARGELIVFIGDDIIAAPELVAEHVAAHRRLGEPAAVLGFTDWDRERMRVTPFLELINRDGQQFSYGHFRDGDDLFFTSFYTSNISVPRSVLGTEPFHPAFTFVDWEDTELGYRLSRRGLRLVLHRAARAYHIHPMTMRRFFRRQQHVGRTVGVLLSLHPELAASAAMPPLTPGRWQPLAGLAARVAVPALSWLDGLGVPLPVRIYRAILLAAFLDGRRAATHKGEGR